MLAQVFLHQIDAMPMALGAAALTVIAVFWLYPAQVRAAAGTFGWMLPAFRSLALLALAAALLKPVLLRPRSEHERGAVLVLLDRSRSMSIVDNARTPAQLVAIADGLGRLKPGVRSSAGVDLRLAAQRLRPLAEAAAAARDDLHFARASGVGADAALRRAAQALRELESAAQRAAALADPTKDVPEEVKKAFKPLGQFKFSSNDRGSWSAADVRARIEAAVAAADKFQADADEALYRSDPVVRQECEGLSKLSRLKLAEDALLRGGEGLVPRLSQQGPVYGFAVAPDLSPIALTHGGEPKPSLGVEPTGNHSELAEVVADAINRFAGQGVRAVVLISDGRQVGGEGALAAGLLARGRGANDASAPPPVFTVAVSPPGSTKDLSIESIDYPKSIYAGEIAVVRVQLRTIGGLHEGATTVHLRAGQLDQVQPINLAAGGTPAVEFQLKVDSPGALRFDVNVDPIAGVEATDENNAAVRWLKVLPDKVRVAAYAGTPTWDFQYLRNALARTPWVRLQAGILPPDQKTRLPLSERQLLAQDVIVLADVPASDLSPTQWETIYNLVARGGSVILIAGDHCPVDYTGRIESSLLPYGQNFAPAWRVWPGESPAFRFVRTAEGERLPALRLEDEEAAANTGRPDWWQQLPGFYRFLPIPRSELRLHARPLLVEVESRAFAGLDPEGEINELALLTERPIGLGRSYFFGARESWRWRMKVGERDHDRFWLQLIHAAAGEPFAARSGPLALDLSRVDAEPNQPVIARVRVADENVRPSDYRIEIVRRGGDVVSTHPLSTSPGDAGSLPPSVTLPKLKEGQYDVRLVAPDGQSVSASLTVADSYEAEMTDVSPDTTLLRRLAESTGGEFVTLDHVARLPQRIAALTDERMRFVEHPLWHSPLLFAFVVACFVAEWAMRKRLGLA